ncbi:coatomer subunit alpha [Salvia divinorum]|uniref:Coatomer subunit alpha n=1 Tax=Salvia divinorum TaxID=28513 RepID=A0ABD1IIJ2_SALDI
MNFQCKKDEGKARVNIPLEVGPADHHIYYHDLRIPCDPVSMFIGYKKAVSYVKFLFSNELASASTDRTLRLWDVFQSVHREGTPTRRISSPQLSMTNSSSFSSGLSFLSPRFFVSASHHEMNETQAIGKPHAYLKFGSPNVEDIEEDAGYYFVSTVCWKVRSQQQGNDQSVGPRTTNGNSEFKL